MAVIATVYTLSHKILEDDVDQQYVGPVNPTDLWDFAAQALPVALIPGPGKAWQPRQSLEADYQILGLESYRTIVIVGASFCCIRNAYTATSFIIILAIVLHFVSSCASATISQAREVMANTPSSDDVEITITHHGVPHNFSFPPDSTIVDLADKTSTTLSILPTSQKFLIPKIGLLKHPFPDPPTPLRSLRNKKIQLLAPTSSDLSSLTPPPTHKPSSRNPASKPTTAYRRIDRQKAQDEAIYTFHTLLPLPYLPNPSRSLDYLTRLRDDAGIKAAMRKHKFSVGVLTEMNPAEHTTHESKTLGLNRNRGEVIELRLRTDAYDGYRDYKTIRKTLCHELAHNVFGEHDRKFWDLTNEIEKEVERGDWRSGGHALTSQEFYNPSDGGMGDHVDGGGWEGGEFVLGGSVGGSSGGGLSRREVLAKAAEERVKRQKEIPKGSSAGTSGSAT